MPTDTVREYAADGRLLKQYKIEVPEAPIDPVEHLQAQVDALTDLVLGGAP